GVQWRVRFTATGLDTDASGAVLSVGSTPGTYGQSAVASSGTGDYWGNNNGSLSYGYSDPVGSSVSGEGLHLTNNPGTSVSNPSGPVAVTGTYAVQWKVTFAQSGLTADANSTVLTVGSDTYQQSDFAAGVPFYWVNATGSLSYAYSDPVGSSV